MDIKVGIDTTLQDAKVIYIHIGDFNTIQVTYF
jgi:hypothetical protein